MLPSNLSIGLAGWSYPDWDRLVYPTPKPKSFHPIELLSEWFDVLEVNTSFYQLLRPEITRLWMRAAGPAAKLQFTVKAYSAFTHAKRLDSKEIAAFHAGLRPLVNGVRLGAVLLQFPWSFQFTPENRQHLMRLRQELSAYPLVAEFRHVSWLQPAATQTMGDLDLGFCNIDQPLHRMGMPPTALRTSALGYVRLHGRNLTNWFRSDDAGAGRDRCDYLYTEAELREWMARIDRVRRLARSVYVVFGNETRGKAVVNAAQMTAMLGGPQLSLPKALRDRYRAELAGFPRRGPEQASLLEAFAA